MRRLIEMNLDTIYRKADTLEREEAITTAALLEAFIDGEFVINNVPCPLTTMPRPSLKDLGDMELREWCKALTVLIGSKHGDTVEFVLED